jgi:cysteine desulfurase
VHTDAVQAVGKIAVSFADLGVDLMTLTPHKFAGPRSIGALVMRPGLALVPLLHGGFQQASLRPGTEDPALAAGFQLALEKALSGQPQFEAEMDALNQLCYQTLQELVSGPLHVNGEGAPRSPHTLNVSFPGVDRQTLLLAADAAGVAFSTGSACSSGSSETSPVLLAMGLESSLAESAIRLSFGWTTTPDAILNASLKIAEIVNLLRP